MERSLVLVKPDAMKRGLAGAVIARLQALGLKMVALKLLHADKALARKHYAVHKDKPFFDDLVAYITSTPIVAAVFEGDHAVERIRKAMGATDPAQAEKGTIRADFGESLERNSVHGSDSPENGEIESNLFFRPDEIYNY
ncbi:MAG: nucleoside-diphosphate kinase [Dehalococcoidia bacterium]|jgi:nucleoside-diphosphate kinase